MAKNADNDRRERLLRLLRARVGHQDMPVDVAETSLEELVGNAKAGRPQFVCLDDDVVLVSLETLADVAAEMEKPETWGEYFATAFDGSPDNADIPMKRYGGRATYILDTSHDDDEFDNPGIPR